MFHIAIYFTAGVCALCAFAELPVAAALSALPLALVLLICPRFRAMAAMPLGFAWAVMHAALALQPVLDPAIEGRTVLVEGTVSGSPERYSGRYSRFRFRITRLQSGAIWQEFDATVRLGWYGEDGAPAAGERWRLAVRLKRAYGMANPGGFDYERWLFQQRIRATGYVRNDPRNTRLSVGHLSALDSFRVRLIQTFSHLGDATGAAFIRALTVGERSAIGSTQWQVLNATGTSHLLAISGLHISLVAGLAFWLARRGWSRLGVGAVRLPAPYLAAGAALGAALLYAQLAGFGIPARRALIMIGVVMLALLTGRQTEPGRLISLALLGTLLFDPLSILAAGWWLSFLAVSSIAWLAAGRCGNMTERIRQRLLTHLALALCMAPVLLLQFQQASLVAPLANLFAVPFVGLLVVPLALFAAAVFAVHAALGTWLLGVAALLLELAWPALQALARLDAAVWTRHQPALWTLAPALFGVALLCMPRGLPGRWLGGVLLLPLLLVRPSAPPMGAAWITLLDVGQGLAAVVRTANHALVYDTGPRYGPAFDTGGAVVVPFLRSQGITRLDTLVVSHGDNDHIGGTDSLLAAYPVRTIHTSVPERLPGTGARACRQGVVWQWDGVEFALLHPGVDDAHVGNNASCVLRVRSAAGGSLLLPGDIEHAAETQLLARHRNGLRANILVAPHHGSATSSSPGFVAAVAPELVIVPAAWRNRYGFPKHDVVERYRAAGAAMLETGRAGAISIRLEAARPGAEVSSWRERSRHVWSWRE
ncbi:MAG: DNA internalization-related competence protein ComEC/Rec2 [Pseudomonadota bacterium]